MKELDRFSGYSGFNKNRCKYGDLSMVYIIPTKVNNVSISINL